MSSCFTGSVILQDLMMAWMLGSRLKSGVTNPNAGL